MGVFFDYFQIAAVILLFFLVVGRALYLLVARNINPIVIGAGKKGLQRIVEFAGAFGLILWIVEVLQYAFHLYFRPRGSFLDTELIDSQPVRLFGVAVVSIAFIIFMWALVSFGSSWRVGIDEQKPGELVTSGVFAFSRNPIFVFIDLYFIGTFLLNGTVIFLVGAVLAIIGTHYQILDESLRSGL